MAWRYFHYAIRLNGLYGSAAANGFAAAKPYKPFSARASAKSTTSRRDVDRDYPIAVYLQTVLNLKEELETPLGAKLGL